MLSTAARICGVDLIRDGGLRRKPGYARGLMKIRIFRNLMLGIVTLSIAALTNVGHAGELLGATLLGKCDNGYLYLLEEVDHQREALKNSHSYGYHTCMVRANDPQPCKELWALQYGPRNIGASAPGGLDNVSIGDKQQQRWAKQHQIEQSNGARLTLSFGYAGKDAWGCSVLKQFQGTGNYTGCAGRLSYLDPQIDIQKKCEQERQVKNVVNADKLKKARLTPQCRGLKDKFNALKGQDNAPAIVEIVHVSAAADMYGCGKLDEAW